MQNQKLIEIVKDVNVIDALTKQNIDPDKLEYMLRKKDNSLAGALIAGAIVMEKEPKIHRRGFLQILAGIGAGLVVLGAAKKALGEDYELYIDGSTNYFNFTDVLDIDTSNSTPHDYGSVQMIERLRETVYSSFLGRIKFMTGTQGPPQTPTTILSRFDLDETIKVYKNVPGMNHPSVQEPAVEAACKSTGSWEDTTGMTFFEYVDYEPVEHCIVFDWSHSGTSHTVLDRYGDGRFKKARCVIENDVTNQEALKLYTRHEVGHALAYMTNSLDPNDVMGGGTNVISIREAQCMKVVYALTNLMDMAKYTV